MRQLLILRGAPGAGKSSWLRDAGYAPYSLCADDIRLMFSGPVTTETGALSIAQNHDKRVWAFLFERLEERMSRGEFICVDACHSKPSDIDRYKKLSETYRYRMSIVDFTHIPEVICQQRNQDRWYKAVPPAVITKMYERFRTLPLPPKYKVLLPTDAARLKLEPLNLNGYQRVVVVGDIHGCYTALHNALPYELRDDTFYIFVGDYIDRGLENREVVQYLLHIKDKPNVLLLEGNHERWLRMWAHDEEVPSREFRDNTESQLAGLDKAEVRQLCRRFAQCAYFTYRKVDYLVTHGGLPKMPENLLLVPADHMIRGVGKYETPVDETWEGPCVQIHGHRNIQDLPVQASAFSYNLEGKVEFGGYLRSVTLFDTNQYWSHHPLTLETPNPNYRKITPMPSDKPLVVALRNDPCIRERVVTDHISSFNFTKKTFHEKSWTRLALKARGLFINVKTGDIVARGYDKFFHVGEWIYTPDFLERELRFPLLASVKYNGFLGLLGYDKESDQPFFCTKSMADSDYVKRFRELFHQQHPDKIEEALRLVRQGNTLTFEVLDDVFDPHIIPTGSAHVMPLHLIANTDEMRILEDYRSSSEIPDYATFTDLVKGLSSSWMPTEGMVFRDQNGLMLKVKTKFYTFWKRQRSNVDSLRAGRPFQPRADEKDFINWVKSNDGLFVVNPNIDIITLRTMYEKQGGTDGFHPGL